MKERLTSLLSLLWGLALLGVLYILIDFASLLEALRRTDLFGLGLALLLCLVLVWMPALRLTLLVPWPAALSLREGTRLILLAWVLNLVLPAKAGDLAKAFFLQRDLPMGKADAVAVVVFEKGLELLSILLVCSAGLLLYPDKPALLWSYLVVVGAAAGTAVVFLHGAGVAKKGLAVAAWMLPGAWSGKVATLQASWMRLLQAHLHQRGRLFQIYALSVLVSLTQLVQVWLFTLALGVEVPLYAVVALAPLAILAGLLSFAGIGTRDAALVVLFVPFMDAPTAAALGVWMTFRYFIFGLMGLPVAVRTLNAGLVRVLRREFSSAGVVGD